MLLSFLLACSGTDSKPITDGENFLSCWPQETAIPIPFTLQKETASTFLVLHLSSQRIMVYNNGKLHMSGTTLHCFHLNKTKGIKTGVEGWGTVSVSEQYLQIDLPNHSIKVHPESLSNQGQDLSMNGDSFTQIKSVIDTGKQILILQ